MEASLTTFDLCVLGIMALSCLFAFFRGLVREILSLAAWIGAAAVTMHYLPAAAVKLTPHFKSATAAMTVGMIGIYIFALIIFSIINIIILKTIKGGSSTGMLDNLLGLVFGAFRGAFIIALGFFLLSATHLPEKDYPDWLKNSITRPYGEKAAATLTKIAPEYVEALAKAEKQAEEKVTPTPGEKIIPLEDGGDIDMNNYRHMRDTAIGRDPSHGE